VSFEDFEGAIESPALKQVALHWSVVRGKRQMPGWNDIQPMKIANQLAIVWSYSYDLVADAFTGRLAGLRIEQKFGKSFRGTPMEDLYPEKDFARLFARAKRVVCDPAFYRGKGMVFRHLDQIGSGERIMLPLAADGVHGDGLIGATDYRLVYDVTGDEPVESDDWFAL
jgi:hypothetical protein